MPEAEPTRTIIIDRIPRPALKTPEELKERARTHIYAEDSRQVIIRRENGAPWRWRSDVVRKYKDHGEESEHLVGLVAFQMFIGKDVIVTVSY